MLCPDWSKALTGALEGIVLIEKFRESETVEIERVKPNLSGLVFLHRPLRVHDHPEVPGLCFTN